MTLTRVRFDPFRQKPFDNPLAETGKKTSLNHQMVQIARVELGEFLLLLLSEIFKCIIQQLIINSCHHFDNQFYHFIRFFSEYNIFMLLESTFT